MTVKRSIALIYPMLSYVCGADRGTAGHVGGDLRPEPTKPA